jgi:hypothetical protein
MGRLACHRVRIGYGYRQTRLREQRNVRLIIANTRALMRLESKLGEYLPQHWRLVLDALMHVLNTEFLTAAGDGGRIPSRDHGNRDTARQNGFDPVAVADMKDLVGFTVCTITQMPVGQHPIDIQYQQADLRQWRRPPGAKASGH